MQSIPSFRSMSRQASVKRNQAASVDQAKATPTPECLSGHKASAGPSSTCRPDPLSFDVGTGRYNLPVNPCCLVAFPRSGTNWLSNVMEEHGFLLATEPFTLHMSRNSALRKDGYEVYVSTRDHGCYEAGDSERRYVSRILDAFSRPSVLGLGFKEVAFGLKMAWLSNELPNLRVIHMKRDPLWVVNSFIQHNLWNRWWSFDERYRNSVRLVMTDEIFFPLREDIDRIDDKDQVSKLGFVWFLDNLLVKMALSCFQSSISVTYEKLMRGDRAEWGTLKDFLSAPGLEIPSSIGLVEERRLSKDPYATQGAGPQARYSSPPQLTSEQIDKVSALVRALDGKGDDVQLRALGATPLQMPTKNRYDASPSRELSVDGKTPGYGDLKEQIDSQMVFLPGGESKKISRACIVNKCYAEYLDVLVQAGHPVSDLYDYGAVDARIWFDKELGMHRVASGFNEHPVTLVSIDSARRFAALFGFRLPLRAELAQALRVIRDAYGDQAVAENANVDGRYGSTTPTIEREPLMGLYDVIGNTLEYVDDRVETPVACIVVGANFRMKAASAFSEKIHLKFGLNGHYTTSFRVLKDVPRGGLSRPSVAASPCR